MWTMLYSLPLMVVVQEMSARIGISSSCGLTGNIKKYYSKKLLFFISSLIIISNVFNIGADVYGMAAAIELITPGSTLYWSFLIVVFILLVTIILPYKKIIWVFKILALSLFAYVIAGLMTIDHWPSLLANLFIPQIHMNREGLLIIVAIFGTSLAPYMAFWQANEEAEEIKMRNKRNEKILVCKFRMISQKDINRTVRDTRIGMFLSNFIGFFVMALTTSLLFNAGTTNVETVREIAEALRPIAGEYAYLLFALGIIGSGLLAIPILAGSSAYVLSEIFNWNASLDKPFGKAKQFYIVMIISTVLGLLIPYFGISPVKALIWTSIIHGIIMPFLIAVLLHMANNPAIVGPNINNTRTNYIAYITLIVATLVLITFGLAYTPLFNS